MTMNNKKAIAARNRQREAPTMRTADNDQKLAKKTPAPDVSHIEPRRSIGITLAPMPIGKIDD